MQSGMHMHNLMCTILLIIFICTELARRRYVPVLDRQRLMSIAIDFDILNMNNRHGRRASKQHF